ncbi:MULTISPECIES: PhzF family phenazine biosynthesis isomerase [Streptomyces]|uniref:PhzF family phenazine biosynthesis protein n=1 Tax=Streptomyces stelliscabiei TaxID=146820 RepID=A0A8I0TUW1_9ACTN|nr:MULTISPECIES: PhzF family phenazine biosynthesis isomerase [Streptomyces]KND43953.1 phenazine biosynthesis protein PhzF [Streptomyces stelliscabiei]MBE1598718.1 PhzF family phenazine biosynthesis protein [Streptomyces stelliscabiei]MDX2516492.1 PhzF family phenazine biosynthesis isomerase [Streptomyces stelliscabiei]MDX2553626.1 PhzF family phenazine biosynthesis isomerase [Streptomyces stelliscabiei]MDX2613398.1 PhzF family phenazine biosynthesis isomerase [Streptomyces stelliscabiei]
MTHDAHLTSPLSRSENATPQNPAPEVLRYSAFTRDPAGGNRAGVVLDASRLDDAAMLAIAAEVGYSETAFVTAADESARRFRVRYFSPLAEVAFCGHATVALAVALAERLGPGEILLDTPAGEIPVATTLDDVDGTVRATLTSVPARSRPATAAERDAALDALGWSPDDLDPALPPHVAFGGVEHLVLAAGSRARLADLDYDFDGLAEVMRRHDWTTVHLVWRESPDHFHARDPFPVGGVVEDPATGAAAAAFGGYLRTLGLVTAPATVTIRQGEDMGRPSDLRVDVSPEDPRTRVTGRAVPIG